MFDWDAELTEEQRDGLIEKLAQRVVRYELCTPALLFLEMHRPFAYLAGQSLLLGSGFLAPLFGPQNVQQIAKLFEKRDNIDRLLERVEALEAARKDTTSKDRTKGIAPHGTRHPDGSGPPAAL